MYARRTGTCLAGQMLDSGKIKNRSSRFFVNNYCAAALSLVASGSVFLTSVSLASSGPFRPEKMTILKVIDKAKGGQVTVNGIPVGGGTTVKRDEEVKTIKAKAQIDIPRSVQGVMRAGQNLTLGRQCIQVKNDSGTKGSGVLLSGKGNVCIGKKTLIFDSTIIIEPGVEPEDTSGSIMVAVLAGNAEIGDAEAVIGSDYDILKRYPTIGPIIGVGASGYANAYPASGGLIVGSVDYFLPLAQHRSSSILYSYTATGSNFDGYLGVTTEVGYRWFTPSSKSVTSLYIGYSGFDSPSCFNNLVNLGGGWEKARWRFGATAGLKAGGCDSGFSFGSLNVSAPIAKFNQIRSAYLSLTPYLIWGDNILSPGNYDGSGSSISPGGKISLDAPITESVSLGTYATVDTINGVSIGGMFKVRFPTGGGIIRDPNLAPQAGSVIQPEPQETDTASSNGVVVGEAYKAYFTADGDQVGETVKLKPEEIIAYITEYLEGTTPLAEGNRIAEVAEKNQALTSNVAAILGRQFLEIASLPASETSQQPFDINTFPTASYACVATDAAKAYAVSQLIQDGELSAAQKVAAADKVYYGRGDSVSGNWAVTTSASKAYRFGNGATCERLNSIIEGSSDYTGPSNPVSTEIIN